ncbi:hypothetical protein DFH08DRAFT_808874 [Mycena albidolilacea]|uniref:Uncharacterized protein n=1 Tax=Mycena albidolilacea TaxID=1033008 RepID=A0AAD7ER95_9AGAR|nr:hypothetical protein DFH08DRAFT_808874 [Mycena albidolilacea]
MAVGAWLRVEHAHPAEQSTLFQSSLRDASSSPTNLIKKAAGGHTPSASGMSRVHKRNSSGEASRKAQRCREAAPENRFKVITVRIIVPRAAQSLRGTGVKTRNRFKMITKKAAGRHTPPASGMSRIHWRNSAGEAFAASKLADAPRSDPGTVTRRVLKKPPAGTPHPQVECAVSTSGTFLVKLPGRRGGAAKRHQSKNKDVYTSAKPFLEAPGPSEGAAERHRSTTKPTGPVRTRFMTFTHLIHDFQPGFLFPEPPAIHQTRHEMPRRVHTIFVPAAI